MVDTSIAHNSNPNLKVVYGWFLVSWKILWDQPTSPDIREKQITYKLILQNSMSHRIVCNKQN